MSLKNSGIFKEMWYNNIKGEFNMNNLLEYKDYLGTVEYSSSDKLLYGQVLGINGLVSYEGNRNRSMCKIYVI